MKEKEKGEVQVSSKRPRPVLMIPLRRCGSHALRLRLNFSPQFYAPYPLHIVDFMPLVSLYGNLGNDDAYFQLIVDVIGLQTVSMVKWPEIVFDPAEIFEALKEEPRNIHRIVWELLFRSGARQGAKVVMDKSLDSVHYAEELMAMFDDLLFLNVLRDPRAQVNSMNKAIIHDFDTLLNTMIWVRAYEAGSSLAEQYPGRVLTIRYEDFVADQETVLRSICAFFSISYDQAMLDISRSGEAQKISGMSALWESNRFAPLPANVDKFKKSLAMEEIEIIETLAGGFMDHYGYERMTPGKATITPHLIAEAQARSGEKRKKAWEDMKRKDHRDYVLRIVRADYLRSVKERLERERGGTAAKAEQPEATALSALSRQPQEVEA